MGGVVRGTGMVVVTDLGLTPVVDGEEVEVEVVDVDVVDDDVEVEDEVVLDDVVGSGTVASAAATGGRPGLADAPPAHHATAPPINTSAPTTAPTPTSGRCLVPAEGIRTCRRFRSAP